MNIDLLVTDTGDAGLVGDTLLVSPIAGIMLDAETGLLNLELENHDTVDLNIPVEGRLHDMLFRATILQMGVIEQGEVQESRQVPLMVINDARAQPGHDAVARGSKLVKSFDSFIRRCVTGQPVHRDDLTNEISADSVMTGVNPAILAYAPHLERQLLLEASPSFIPSGPGPRPGGGALPSIRPRRRN